MILAKGHTDQWNELDSPETEPHKYGQLIFDKSTMVTEKGQMVLYKWMSVYKKWTLTHLTSYTKVN